MGRQLTSLFALFCGALVTGCGAGAPGLDSSEASVGEALTRQGVERCSAGRFESTVATACTGTLRRVDAAPVDASLAPILDTFAAQTLAAAATV